MIFSRSKVLTQNCLTCLNVPYPNKNKALISALTPLLNNAIGASCESFTGKKKGTSILKTLLCMNPLSTFTSLLPHKGNAFTSPTWNKGYFIGILISPKVGLA